MQFVDDDVAEVFEDLGPLGVVGKDSGVEHVRVGEDHVGAFPDLLARVLRRVTVIGESTDAGAHGFDDGVELVELIFGEGLSGKQIKCARFGVSNEAAEDGQVVAEGLAASGRRDDDDVGALLEEAERFGLVGVELLDSAGL